ncbi:Crp/Fnr family transcriptional regulator [Deinococcus sonorensis]|uniref:Helix-turn-helix domain-containing protein n=2 Tax=Deinococcus sonorensis TaxID=309891 RepID=A0AAU7U7P4_9DEIO
MSGVASKQRFRRGEWVFQQGDPAPVFYQAETGLVRLMQSTLRGRTLTVRHVLPGDYFGEAALDPAPATHHHAAEALTPATIRLLQPEQLTAATLLDISRNLSTQLRRAMLHEVHLQSGDLRQRLVRYLLELADTPLGAEDAQDHLYVRTTHELLAEGSGSTRESVSKVVTELRDLGLIETGYRHITLLHLEGLRALAGPAPLDRPDVAETFKELR